jgi:hypothetical protein
MSSTSALGAKPKVPGLLGDSKIGTAARMIINHGSYQVQLGRLVSDIYARAPWAGDGYPAWQKFADEFERLLQFAENNGVLPMYTKELCARAAQRDSAIEELRVAMLIADAGFSIGTWRPAGLGTREGEFLVRTRAGETVFVEVKSPGWEGQISANDRAAGRLKQPKYRDTEAFWVNNGPPLAYAVEKAYPKFAPSSANLLVISDDLHFPLGFGTSLWVVQALYSDGGKFVDTRYENLGGIGIVVKQQTYDRAWCEMQLFVNPFARMQLPREFLKVFGATPP